jgi:DHA2 family multidrug resistance protein
MDGVPQQSRAAMAIIVITAALASLLEIIDSSIVNVAIPTMMGNLGATLDEISWVSTAYMIANSIVLPIAAWLGTRLGRRRYFTGAILAFTAASFACGIAPNLPLLIFFRIIQGLAGGALLPTSQTLIQEQFPREKAGIATAIFGMSIMIGPTLGPTLGGYLTDNFGWRSIFNVNVPIGLAAAVMSSLHVRDLPREPGRSQSGDKAGVDWLGLILLCVGVGFFQFILERGEVEGWDSRIIHFSEVMALFGCVSFVLWELKIEHPIMNLRLFKENAVSAGTLLMMALGVMIYALTFVVPVFASRVIGMTATQTGYLFIPGSLLTAAVMFPVGASMRVVNPKYLVLIGMGLGELALLSMSRFTTITGQDDLYLPMILRGVAAGFLFIPINGMVLSQFRGEALGQVSGMMNFFRQMGGSIGISSLSTLITRFSAQNYNDLMSQVNALNPAGYYEYLRGSSLPHLRMASEVGMGMGREVSLKALYGRAIQQVFVMSFEQLCWVIIIVFALGLIPLKLIKLPKKPAGPVLDAH